MTPPVSGDDISGMKPANHPVGRVCLGIAATALALSLGTFAFLLVRGISAGGGEAIANLGPNPPESPSISGPWPDLAGKVLHWQNYNYSLNAQSPDEANGEQIRGDIWLRVGPDNKPLALRGTFTYPDGSFQQEYLYANNQAIVIYDQPIMTVDGNSDDPVCRQDQALDEATFAKLLDVGEPLLVDRSRVQSLGFTVGDTPPTNRPSLDEAAISQTAQETLGDASGPEEVWAKEDSLDGGIKAVDSIQVDQDGWLAAETRTIIGSDGSEISVNRRSFTPVEVFSGTDLNIDSVFDSKTLHEGCSE